MKFSDIAGEAVLYVVTKFNAQIFSIKSCECFNLPLALIS